MAIDDDDIRQRMVDLDDIKGVFGLVLPGNRSEAVTCCFRAAPRQGEFGWRQSRDPRLHGVPGRRSHATQAAKPADLLVQLVDARLLTRLVEIPQRFGDHGFGLIGQPPTAASRTRRLRQQRTRQRMLTVRSDQLIKTGPPKAEFAASAKKVRTAESLKRHQSSDHSLSYNCLAPDSVIDNIPVRP